MRSTYCGTYDKKGLFDIFIVFIGSHFFYKMGLPRGRHWDPSPNPKFLKLGSIFQNFGIRTGIDFSKLGLKFHENFEIGIEFEKIGIGSLALPES